MPWACANAVQGLQSLLVVLLPSLTICLTLQGIGPAPASAMLTVYSPSLPFMSDEALAAALPGRPAYTAKKYMQLVQALRDKAIQLTASSGQHVAKLYSFQHISIAIIGLLTTCTAPSCAVCYT